MSMKSRFPVWLRLLAVFCLIVGSMALGYLFGIAQALSRSVPTGFW